MSGAHKHGNDLSARNKQHESCIQMQMIYFTQASRRRTSVTISSSLLIIQHRKKEKVMISSGVNYLYLVILYYTICNISKACILYIVKLIMKAWSRTNYQRCLLPVYILNATRKLSQTECFHSLFDYSLPTDSGSQHVSIAPIIRVTTLLLPRIDRLSSL